MNRTIEQQRIYASTIRMVIGAAVGGVIGHWVDVATGEHLLWLMVGIIVGWANAGMYNSEIAVREIRRPTAKTLRLKDQ